jgi:hypothetical protein
MNVRPIWHAMKRKLHLTFGKTIPDLYIDGKPAPYPVLNERDARAAAGIMLLIGAVAFVYAFLLRSYTMIDVVVVLFALEFALRIISSDIAPIYALAKLTVRGMRPEWTGAAQKRFAWTLGLMMALTVTVLIHGFGARGLGNAILCGTCLVLMWLETSLGLCVGCKLYYGLMKLGLVKQPDVMPACPGGACPMPKR